MKNMMEEEIRVEKRISIDKSAKRPKPHAKKSSVKILGKKRDGKHYVYLILCRDDSIYCGYTTDIEKRYEAHVSGKAAAYTRSHPPKRLLYYETYDSKSTALKREYAIKQLTHTEKLELVRTGEGIAL